MSDERAILAYAQPASTSPDADAATTTVFTFAYPPTRAEKTTLVLLFMACAVGAIAVGGLAYNEYVNDRRERLATLGVAVFGLGFLIVLVIIGWREWSRLRRFGAQDVRFEISGTKLVVLAPQQWGAKPRALEVKEITGIVARGTGLHTGRVPSFEIHVRRRGTFKFAWTIRVAVADRGVINRSIADLNRAIERAKASETAPVDTTSAR